MRRLLPAAVLLLALPSCDFGGPAVEGAWSLDAAASWDRNAPNLPGGLGEIARQTFRTRFERTRWKLDFRADGTFTGDVNAEGPDGPILLQGTWTMNGNAVGMMMPTATGGAEVWQARIEDESLVLSSKLPQTDLDMELVFRRAN